MMTHIQFLLCKLAEECNETAQRALKQQQFGGRQQQKEYRKNRDRLRSEIMDVLAHISFLTEAGEIDVITDQQQKEHTARKWRRVMRYKGVSKRKGLVE